MTRIIKATLQHNMNSLHFYCYLCRLNVNRKKALKAAQAYERVVHFFLYSQ